MRDIKKNDVLEYQNKIPETQKPFKVLRVLEYSFTMTGTMNCKIYMKNVDEVLN